MLKVQEAVRAACEQTIGYNVHNRTKYGTRQLRTYDREEERNERLNTLYVRYTERINVLKGRIACMMGSKIEQPTRIMRLGKLVCDYRTKQEQVVQGNLPRRKYRLLRVPIAK